MITYFQDTITSPRLKVVSEYKNNKFSIFKLKPNKFLVTAPHRAWIILNREERRLFLHHEVHRNPRLFKALFSLGIIHTKENEFQASQQLKKKYSFLNQPPVLNIIIPTLKCNLQCDYCITRSSPNLREKRMTFSLAKRVVDFIFSIPHPSKKIQIQFYGGEPLLRWDLIKKIIKYSKEKSQKMGFSFPSFILNTNLIAINKKIAKEIENYNSETKFVICTSLDGPKKIHDSYRKYPDGKGSHREVVKWIKTIKKNYQIPLRVIATVTKKSLNKEREIINELLRYNFTDFTFSPLIPRGRASKKKEKKKDIYLSPENFSEFWKKSIDYLVELNKEGTTIKEWRTLYLISNLLTTRAHFMCSRIPCGAGISQLGFGPDGTIYACNEGRKIEGRESFGLGNVTTHSYPDIAFSKTVTELRSIRVENLPVCSECPWGPYCGYCVTRCIKKVNEFKPYPPRHYDCRLYRRIIPFLFSALLDKEKREVFFRWKKDFF